MSSNLDQSQKKDSSSALTDRRSKEGFSFRHYFHKADILLILAMLLITLAFFLLALNRSKQSGARVRIEASGSTYGTYSLQKDQTIKIPDSDGKIMNTVKIKDGQVWMKDADCPDKLCVKMGKIHADGQTIVCLPNRVVVTVLGGEKSEYDSVAN